MILCDNIDKKLKELEAKPGANKTGSNSSGVEELLRTYPGDNSRSANSINDKDDR